MILSSSASSASVNEDPANTTPLFGVTATRFPSMESHIRDKPPAGGAAPAVHSFMYKYGAVVSPLTPMINREDVEYSVGTAQPLGLTFEPLPNRMISVLPGSGAGCLFAVAVVPSKPPEAYLIRSSGETLETI